MAPEHPGSESHSWQARPVVARLLRGLVLGGPILVSAIAALIANRLAPATSGLALGSVRLLAIMGLSTVVIWASDRLARRLLPLAVLMQLSLIFPDQAPSRLKAALKGGSSKRLERLVENTRTKGLDNDPAVAARQVVELIGALGDHDRRTRGHSERVRLYAEMIGKEMHLTNEERQKLQWGALLHDLGKLLVPPEILNKQGAPTPAEWEVIQQHPAAGMRLIEPLRDFLGEWAHAIGGHHERWDGRGYPNRLKGEEIPRGAAIVAVADSYEVMVAVRSYKKSMSPSDARAELSRCAGYHFSPEVVRAFLSLSIGRLRLIAGPLAALAQTPFVGSAIQLPSTLTTVPVAFTSSLMPAAATAAAVVTSVSLVIPAPPRPPAYIPESVALQAASTEQVGEHNLVTTPPLPSQDATEPKEDIKTALADDAREAASTSSLPVATTPASNSTSTTLPPYQEPMDEADLPLDSPLISPFPEYSPPTLPEIKLEPEPTERLLLMVDDSPFRLTPKPLDGASFSGGERVYVIAKTTGTSVDYQYPGGTSTATDKPFDMLGKILIAPKFFVVPFAPGTYNITATVHGNGPSSTVVATFTVT